MAGLFAVSEADPALPLIQHDAEGQLAVVLAGGRRLRPGFPVGLDRRRRVAAHGLAHDGHAHIQRQNQIDRKQGHISVLELEKARNRQKNGHQRAHDPPTSDAAHIAEQNQPVARLLQLLHLSPENQRSFHIILHLDTSS